jgi:hypothetical protein
MVANEGFGLGATRVPSVILSSFSRRIEDMIMNEKGEGTSG